MPVGQQQPGKTTNTTPTPTPAETTDERNKRGFDEMVALYNQYTSELASVQGTQYTPWYPQYGKVNYGDVLEKAQEAEGAYSAFYRNRPTPAPVYDPTTDPIAKQVTAELNAVVAQGQPTFSSPATTEAQDITNWQTQLQQINQPTQDYALQQLNKQVNQTYAYNNPYSVGSGNQVQASQDATNQLLMQSLSNQNAQAVALGQASYNQDYNTAWNQYVMQQQQLANAQNTLLSLSQIPQQEQTQAFYSQQGQNFNQQNMATQNQYQQQQLAQQEQYAEQIAQMYQPQSSEWYSQLIQPILTGVGNSIGGPVGGAIGSGIGSLFGSSQNTQSSGMIPQYSYPWQTAGQTSGSNLNVYR